MKIYVITAGCYSNYHICAVTDDKKSAENLRLLYSEYDGAYIEEYDTSYLPEKPKEYWSICVDLDGTVSSAVTYYYTELVEPLNQVKLVGFGYYVNVVAKDRDHALKIAFDKIAEYKYEHMEEVEKAEAEKHRWSTYLGNFGNFQLTSSAWGMEEYGNTDT